MENTSIFCLTLDPRHVSLIEKLSYIPVGLGNKKFSDNCLSDKTNSNISSKNPYYGEYTFHYWIWKNHLENIKTKWVGFCQYRKFFIKKELPDQELTFETLNSSVIKHVEDDREKFDCIMGNKFSVKNFKISKIVKNHLKSFLLNPSLIFKKDKRNLRFHFDLFHGKGNLDLAISLLDDNNREQFKKFMESQNSFNPHNMFICKTEIIKDYYEEVFPWLEKCEKLFGFDGSQDYGLRRIYGFLAERFLSYWFTKNYKIKELPILGKDLSDYKYL